MMGARFADVFRHTAFEHHVSHRLDDTEAVDAACHPDRQAFPSELVDQGHQSNLAPIMGLSLDEVVAPDMIAMLRPQADARSVVQPEPAARSLLPGYFKPLTAPDPLDTITADLPIGLGKQLAHVPIISSRCRRGRWPAGGFYVRLWLLR